MEREIEKVEQSLKTKITELESLSSNIDLENESLSLLTSNKEELKISTSVDIQECRGILSVKEREFEDCYNVVVKHIEQLKSKIEKGKKDFNEREEALMKISEEGNIGKNDDLDDLKEQLESIKRVEEKLGDSLKRKLEDISKLKEQMRESKLKTPEQQSRTPSKHRTLKSVFDSMKDLPSTARKSRYLAPHVPGAGGPSSRKPVEQSPMRSFLAPPSRNTPSRLKKKSASNKSSFKKKSVAEKVATFDDIMGISDDNSQG